MLPDLVRQLLLRTPDAPYSGEPPLSLTAIALTSSGRPRKLNFMVFCGKKPVLFVKTVLNFAADQLRLEHAALALLDSQLGGSVPRSFGVSTYGGRTGLVLSVVDGMPLLTLLRTIRRAVRPTLREDLLVVQAWLETLQAQSGYRVEPLDAVATIRGHEEALAGADLMTSTRRAYFDHLSTQAARFAGTPLPLTRAHGDFWPGNILLDRDCSLRVVDWEYFTPEASPLRDLWFFLFTYTWARPRRTWSWDPPNKALRRAFLVDGWYSRQVADVVRRHLLSLGIPTELADLLLYLELRSAEKREGFKPLGPIGTDWTALVLLWADSGGFRQLSAG